MIFREPNQKEDRMVARSASDIVELWELGRGGEWELALVVKALTSRRGVTDGRRNGLVDPQTIRLDGDRITGEVTLRRDAAPSAEATRTRKERR